MRAFESLSRDTWSDIAARGQATVLSVRKIDAGLSTFDRAAQSFRKPGYVEYPPTTAALTDKGAAELIVGLSRDTRGDWNRFLILVYRNGGHIYFKEIDSRTFEACVEFD